MSVILQVLGRRVEKKVADPFWEHARKPNPPVVILSSEAWHSTRICKGCRQGIDLEEQPPNNLIIRIKGDTGYKDPQQGGAFVPQFSNTHYHAM